MIRKLIKDLTTGKNKEDHEIVHVIMAVHLIILPLVLCCGVAIYIWGFFYGKVFDLQTFLSSVLTYTMGVGTLMASGAASIFFKHTTEPDGSISSIESIKKID